jgi:transposase
MGYLQGDDRQQQWLMPRYLDDYVGADNAVRVIDLFVERLDFKEAGLPLSSDGPGRPGYAPADLLKLFIYGYLNRVRSSRDLERLSQRNVEVIWLLRHLQPDHKTISEFRREHRAAFKAIFRQFNVVCRDLELFGAELVAIDGSIFQAVNAKDNNFTQPKLEALLERIDAGIEGYLKELEGNESAEHDAVHGAAKAQSSPQLASKLEKLQARQEHYARLLEGLKQSGASQISLIDADGRLMKKSTSKDCIVGYNVQSAVDAAHHLMVEVVATTQGNDVGQLNAVAQQAKEQLGVSELSVVADGGYYASHDLKAAAAQGIRVHVPAPRDKMDKAGLYARASFSYQQGTDCYKCPAGQELTRHSDTPQDGKVYEVYYNSAACAACALRAKCTAGKYRKIKHVTEHEVMERIAARFKEQPDIYPQRKNLVEHPFGTLKFWWAQGTFLTRGLAAVNAEISLSALAYNLRRALNILGVPALLAHLQKPGRSPQTAVS